MALGAEQLPDWAQFWNWFGGGGGGGEEADGHSTAEIQTQLNNLNLGNVSTGDISNWLETAYHKGGGDAGGFPYPPAGSSPAEAVSYYQQHITIDASQNWNFHAEDGSVINLGNIGGDVITNPQLNLEYHEGQGYEPPEDPAEYEPEQVPEYGEGEGYEPPYEGEGEGYEPPYEGEGEGYEPPYEGEGEGYEPPPAGEGDAAEEAPPGGGEEALA
jgi:hypothetical protein